MIEKINKIKDLTKGFITSENSDSFVEIYSLLDEVATEHESQVNENGKLKDKIVEYVKTGNFQEKPKDDVEPETLSIDEALKKAINNIKK